MPSKGSKACGSYQPTERVRSRVLWDLTTLFASPHTSVSSFELLQSGLVDGSLLLIRIEKVCAIFSDLILRFKLNAPQISVAGCKELLLDSLVNRKNKALSSLQTPFSTFVKKLQEGFARMESFDVIAVSQGSDGKSTAISCLSSALNVFSSDSKRGSPPLLARQLRLRLISEDDSGVPRNLHNVVVSIHAIATFQAPQLPSSQGSGSTQR